MSLPDMKVSTASRCFENKLTNQILSLATSRVLSNDAIIGQGLFACSRVT